MRRSALKLYAREKLFSADIESRYAAAAAAPEVMIAVTLPRK